MSWLASVLTRSFRGLPEGYYSRQLMWGLIYALLIATSAYFLVVFVTPFMVKIIPSLQRVIVFWRQTTETVIQIAIGVLAALTVLYPYSRFMYSRFFRSILRFGTVYMPVKTMITLNFYNGLVSWVLSPVLAPACFVYLFFSNKPSRQRQGTATDS